MTDLGHVVFECQSRALKAMRRIHFPSFVSQRNKFELILENNFAFVLTPLLNHLNDRRTICRWLFLHYYSPTFRNSPIRLGFYKKFPPNSSYWKDDLKLVLNSFYDKHNEIYPYRMFQLLLADSDGKKSVRISISQNEQKSKIEGDALIITNELAEMLRLGQDEWHNLIQALKDNNKRGLEKTILRLTQRREQVEISFLEDVQTIDKYFHSRLTIKSENRDRWCASGFLRMIQTTMMLRMNDKMEWNHLYYIPLENPMAPSSGVVFTLKDIYPDKNLSQFRSIVNNTMNMFYSTEISQWEIMDRKCIMHFQMEAPNVATYAAFASLCKKHIKARIGLDENRIVILQCEIIEDGVAVRQMGTEEDRFFDYSYLKKISNNKVSPICDSENIYVFDNSKENNNINEKYFSDNLFGNNGIDSSKFTFLALLGSDKLGSSKKLIGCIVLYSDESLEQYKNYLDLFASSAALRLSTLELYSAQLKRHFSRVLVNKIMEKGIQKVIGSIIPQNNIAIMFIDIRNFSKVIKSIKSHRKKAQFIKKVIKGFKIIVENEVLNNEGILDKFIGDGAMAFFGYPEKMGTNGLVAASRVAVKISERIKKELNGLNVGISIYYINEKAMEVYIGNVGGQDRIDFTVMGDAVNLAARIVDVAGRVVDTATQKVVDSRSQALCYVGLNEADMKQIPTSLIQTIEVPINWNAITNYLSTKVQNDIEKLPSKIYELRSNESDATPINI